MLRTYSNLDSFVGKVRAFGTVVFPYRGMLLVTRAFVSMETFNMECLLEFNYALETINI